MAIASVNVQTYHVNHDDDDDDDDINYDMSLLFLATWNLLELF